MSSTNDVRRMTVFLAAEALVFGGLLGAFAVSRAAHPEGFHWAHAFLDWRLGAVSAAVLLVSSAAMAAAVRCARLSHRRALTVMLALTFLGGAGFVGIKAAEYTSKVRQGLAWGARPRPAKRTGKTPPAGSAVASAAAAKPLASGDAGRGKPVFLGTCAACHGLEGTGIKGQGANLAGSTFVAQRGENDLLAFVKKGRQSFDSDSTMHLMMPARGGNPALTDQNLLDAIAYVLKLHAAATAAKEHPAPAAVGVAAVAGVSPAASGDQPRWIDGELWVPKSIIAPAAAGPAGIRRELIPMLSPRGAKGPPPGSQLFFALYLLITGLHGLQVLGGMVMIAMLGARAWLGRPVALGGLYWYVVGAIGIFLFPLLYLVG